MKVKIITDSTADLSPELVRQYDVDVVPLYVVMGDRISRDGTEATPEDIYSYVEGSSKLPKTSAPNLNDFLGAFQKWRELGYEVVHFNISADFSSSHATACIAASEVGGVEVVDTRNLSTGSGLIVLHACEMAQKGASAKENAVRLRKRWRQALWWTASIICAWEADALPSRRWARTCSSSSPASRSSTAR